MLKACMRGGCLPFLPPLQLTQPWAPFEETKTQDLGRLQSPHWNVLAQLHFWSPTQFVQQTWQLRWYPKSLVRGLKPPRRLSWPVTPTLGITSSLKTLQNLKSSRCLHAQTDLNSHLHPHPHPLPGLPWDILCDVFTWKAAVPGQLPVELASYNRT